jgi:hypothetical protein
MFDVVATLVKQDPTQRLLRAEAERRQALGGVAARLAAVPPAIAAADPAAEFAALFARLHQRVHELVDPDHPGDPE